MSFRDRLRRAPGWSLPQYLWWAFCSRCCWLFFLVIYRPRVFGREHLPRTGPVIVVSNHQSHYDPPFVGTFLGDRPPGILARKSLFVGPFGWLIRGVAAIPVDLDRSAKEGIRASLAELEAGRCMLIFPEGTRTRDGTVGPFKPGFGMLVRKTGATIVPVAIDGVYEAFSRYRRIPRLFSRRFGLMAGKAITADEFLSYDTEGGLKLVHDRVVELREDLRKRLGRADDA